MEKFIVVGAGILGASTAYHLAKTGADVTVIDRKDIGQATDAAAGIVCPWISQRRNQAWYRLAKGGARFYPGLIQELKNDGESNTGYSRVGAISIHTDSKKLAEMEKRARKRREDAPEIGEIHLLSQTETKALFPLIADGYSSVYVGGAARVDGRAIRDALLRSAERYGANIVNGDAELLLNGTNVIGTKVNNETYFADTVIVTAGAWGSQLLKPLGVNFQVDFQKGQILHMELQGMATDQWPVVMPPGNQYIVPFQDGKIVAGATHEKNTGFDLRVTAGSMQDILAQSLQFAPGLSSATIVEARVGFRPFTADFLPVIGPLPGFGGVLVANGLGASGLTMGPYLGSLMAKLVLKEKIDLDLAPYAISGALD
ncbi:NAD(P)/FAD-dependent oxidoreductase [Lederbergia wuyishanensis]|uniref:D-amino-acid dehydrogenase n=1 Tax=Lederbergia wuyishanensis TaxID=1347903 RepID=A0ABU0D3Y1_9BACI|nr:FAD-binding oxidoreductase [Lederbergia wuyishanensis]MCJ8007721.1 FAD-binding oxidoreductase [Lederbergia wuyishanensis]MDQ0343116.1 D-amino-acid dehydrogenase [Lederbergia wuyishanensis]